MLLDIHLTLYVITHILVPRKQNFGQQTKTHVRTIWLPANKIETNWASTMIHHMMNIKGKNMWLSFGWVIKKYLGALWIQP